MSSVNSFKLVILNSQPLAYLLPDEGWDIWKRNPRALSETGDTGTIAGSIMGTPQYMASEQARGDVDALDARSDIYSLGAILFHLLYLRSPVAGETAHAILAKVAEGALDWPGAMLIAKNKLPHLPGGRIPYSLLAVCRKALSLNPAERYQSIAVPQKDVAAYQAGFATNAENAKLMKQIVLLVKRHKGVFATAFAAWLIITAMAVWFVLKIKDSERVASAQRDRADAALADLKKTAPSMLALAAGEAAFQRYDSALEKAAAALALDPTVTAAYWRRGWILLAQEKLPEALEALRLAQGKDPTNQRFAKLIPLVEKMAAAPEKARHSTEIVRPIYKLLAEVGATGESTPFIRYLAQTKEEDRKLVQERLEQWLGKPRAGERAAFNVTIEAGNFLTVYMSGVRVSTLEPLRAERRDGSSTTGAESKSPK